MWKIKSDSDTKRIYANDTTGSVCTQTMCYTDKDGNKWWQFDDIISMPDLRHFAVQKINSLYTLGLSKIDLDTHIQGLKTILKSDDKERYEKAYANVLDFENKANSATDAVKQLSSLTCVYFTLNDEPIDSFGNDLQIKKMSLLEADITLHSFFLTKQIESIENSRKFSNLLSQIALQK